MIRRPPRSTRTDTLFPYTTLFRSQRGHIRRRARPKALFYFFEGYTVVQALHQSSIKSLPLLARGKVRDMYAVGDDKLLIVASDRLSARSEERRVGKECVSPCRSRWSPYHYKKKEYTERQPANTAHKPYH